MTSLLQCRIHVEVLVDGLPNSHSVAADLSKWNVQVKGMKQPVPFELLGTWLFEDNQINKEIVEYGGICGALCWALHEAYPGLLVTNLSPGHHSIRCEFITKQHTMQQTIKSIEDGTMAQSIQKALGEIPSHFSEENLKLHFTPIKILRLRRIDSTASNDVGGESPERMTKEIDYWKSESSKLVKQVITLEIERDRYRSRGQNLQKNLRDAEERNLKLTQSQASQNSPDEMQVLKEQALKEEYKRKLAESEIETLKKQIKALEEVDEEESEEVVELKTKIQNLTAEVHEMKIENEYLREGSNSSGTNEFVTEIPLLQSLLYDKEVEIKKWRERADELDEKLQDLDETCDLLRQSIEEQMLIKEAEGTSSENEDESSAWLEEEEEEALSDETDDEKFEEVVSQNNEKIEQIKNDIQEKDSTIVELKDQLRETEKKSTEFKREMEAMKESQRQTEKTMEAREQNYRSHVVDLKKEIYMLESKLSAAPNDEMKK